MSDIADDPMNGYLLRSSPLGQALSRGSPGDELSSQASDREMDENLIKDMKQAGIADDKSASECLEIAARQWLDRRKGL